MKAIKQVDKIVSVNIPFLKNKFNLKVNEMSKNFRIYTGCLNCIKILPKQGF